MTLTRKESKAALTHVITNVFGVQMDEPLALALKDCRYTDIDTVMMMSFEEIDRLYYIDEAGDPVPLLLGLRSPLRLIKFYESYCTKSGKPIGDDWLSVTEADYKRYLRSDEYLTLILSGASSPATSTFSPGGKRIFDPVADFRKGIKRDPALFPIYKDERQWDTWQRATRAQARAQNVIEVLNHSYNPRGTVDTDLFDENKNT